MWTQGSRDYCGLGTLGIVVCFGHFGDQRKLHGYFLSLENHPSWLIIALETAQFIGEENPVTTKTQVQWVRVKSLYGLTSGSFLMSHCWTYFIYLHKYVYALVTPCQSLFKAINASRTLNKPSRFKDSGFSVAMVCGGCIHGIGKGGVN